MQDGFIPFAKGLRFRIGPRRPVSGNPFTGKHLLDAEDMVSVADRKAAIHMVGMHDGAYPSSGLSRVCALGFGDEMIVGYAQGFEVFPAYGSLGEFGIGACATGSNHHWRQSSTIQVRGVVQTGFEHRRGS